MIVLDNNILGELARSQTDPVVKSHLSKHAKEQWVIPSIVLYEYLSHYDSQSRRRKERRQVEKHVSAVLPFDGDVAEEAANIESLLESTGASLDPADLFIAAIARKNGGTLLTQDESDFDKSPLHELMDIEIVV